MVLSFRIVKGIDSPEIDGCLVVADRDVNDVYILLFVELNNTVSVFAKPTPLRRIVPAPAELT